MSEVDYYDVQNMIRDACVDLRGSISDAVSAAKEDLREELDELRREIDSLTTTVQNRTDHLV